MFKSFEDLQALNKQGYEAFASATAALVKGYQAYTKEVTDFTRKSYDKGAAHWQSAIANPTAEKAIAANQAFAKETFEDVVAQATKLGELSAATAKDVFKPFESVYATAATAAAKVGK